MGKERGLGLRTFSEAASGPCPGLARSVGLLTPPAE